MILIELTKGLFTKIDKEDWPYLCQFSWHALGVGLNNFYAATAPSRRLGKRKPILMHRLLMNAPDGLEVDHINGDRLDNRKCNLRICTVKQNRTNRRSHSDSAARLKGVSKIHGGSRWRARINIDGKEVSLGGFATKEEAYEAYCKAAIKYHGAYANLK